MIDLVTGRQTSEPLVCLRSYHDCKFILEVKICDCTTLGGKLLWICVGRVGSVCWFSVQMWLINLTRNRSIWFRTMYWSSFNSTFFKKDTYFSEYLIDVCHWVCRRFYVSCFFSVILMSCVECKVFSEQWKVHAIVFYIFHSFFYVISWCNIYWTNGLTKSFNNELNRLKRKIG